MALVCVCCSPSLAEYVLPLLVDKLSSTHVPAKVEALKTIQAAARYTNTPPLSHRP